MADLKPVRPQGKAWFFDAEDAIRLVASWKEFVRSAKRASLEAFVKSENGKDVAVTEIPEDPSVSPAGRHIRYVGYCDTIYVTVNPCNPCHQTLLTYRQWLSEYVDLAGNIDGRDPNLPADNDDRPRFSFLLASPSQCLC